MKRKLSSAALALGTAAGMLVLAPTGAQAANTCEAWKTTHVRTALPDLYGVSARCSDLNGNTKARGGLDVTADVDVYTQFFTTKNTTYSSSSRRAAVREAYLEIRAI